MQDTNINKLRYNIMKELNMILSVPNVYYMIQELIEYLNSVYTTNHLPSLAYIKNNSSWNERDMRKVMIELQNIQDISVLIDISNFII